MKAEQIRENLKKVVREAKEMGCEESQTFVRIPIEDIENKKRQHRAVFFLVFHITGE